MERFKRTHTCVDGGGFVMGGGVPAFGDVGRSGVDGVVAFVVEGDGFQAFFIFFDIGAGPDSIILEEN